MAEDLLFHISKAVTAIKNDRFTVFLKSAQGQYFLCSCTVQPPNFRTRLSYIRKSDTFTTYSYFCIVTDGKIQGLNQIGVNASSAAGSISLASVQDGDKYTFTLLLQPRSRKSPLPVGTPYPSTSLTAISPSSRPSTVMNRHVTSNTAVQVYGRVHQKVYAATTSSFFEDTVIYGEGGSKGPRDLQELKGLGRGWLSTGGDPRPEATPSLQDSDSVHIYHCDGKSAHSGKVLVASTKDFQKYPRILKMIKQVKELRQLMFPARRLSSRDDGDSESPVPVVLDMSCLPWNALRSAVEYATTRKLRFHCTQDRTYDRSPEAFQELLDISDVAMELDMNDLFHECATLILDR
ncbi:hypothetical protein CPB97_008769 [Podila verticillata]|nr:hypothetical protein CPB97_008769 [Podila verticillata]